VTWVERLNAYERLVRLDKPIGILLLLWPTLWGLWFSSYGHPRWDVLAVFLLGTVLMRSSGCAINDFADRDLDPHVSRTRNRPLAAGLIQPREALAVAAVLALLAFGLVLTMNRLTIYLSVVALFLAASYPFTKRFLSLPQAYLGIAFGFGIPMAWAAQTDYLHPWCWVLMVANIFWAIAYDTEYAMVDRADDVKVGIRTSAITFGRFDVLAVMVCHVVFVALLAIVGWHFHFSYWYFLGLVGAVLLIAAQYRMIRHRDPRACFRAFLQNNWVGAVIFAGICAHYYFPHGPSIS
jgi:4-hydroxybenzoate polyprenyltransferase